MDLRYIGLLINSALYLTGCFAAGLATGNPWAWKIALAAMGVTYLCYFVQTDLRLAPASVNAVVGASILLGALAGIALLVRA